MRGPYTQDDLRREEYEEWKTRLIRIHNNDFSSWRPVGNDWLCATKDNAAYHQVVFHLCIENHKSLGRNINCALESCNMCHASVPEGIRMIALLEEL